MDGWQQGVWSGSAAQGWESRTARGSIEAAAGTAKAFRSLGSVSMGGEMVYLSSLAAGVSPLSLADPFRGGIRLDNRRNKKVKKEYSINIQ